MHVNRAARLRNIRAMRVGACGLLALSLRSAPVLAQVVMPGQPVPDNIQYAPAPASGRFMGQQTVTAVPGATPGTGLSTITQAPSPAQTWSFGTANTVSPGGYMAGAPGGTFNALGINRPTSQSFTSIGAAQANANANASAAMVQPQNLAAGQAAGAVLMDAQSQDSAMRAAGAPSVFTPEEQAQLPRNAGREQAASSSQAADRAAAAQAASQANQGPAPGTRFSGQAHAVDGGTLVVENQRLLLRGLVVPELGQACSDGRSNYWCGRRSRDHLDQLLARGPVVCTVLSTEAESTEADCMVGRDDLSTAMIAAGQAKSNDTAFAPAMTEAMSDHRGLWYAGGHLPVQWQTRAR